jgi:hypothetical protein
LRIFLDFLENLSFEALSLQSLAFDPLFPNGWGSQGLRFLVIITFRKSGKVKIGEGKWLRKRKPKKQKKRLQGKVGRNRKSQPPKKK